MVELMAVDIPKIKMRNVQVEKREVLLIGEMAFKMIERGDIHLRDVGKFVYTCLQMYRKSSNKKYGR